MAETQRQTNSKDVGSATVSSLSPRRARGVSDVQDASQKINQDEFLNRLTTLYGKKSQSGFNCGLGKLLATVEEPIKSKLNDAILNQSVEASAIAALLTDFGYEISSSIVRRHRRRMSGREGCKCPREPR